VAPAEGPPQASSEQSPAEPSRAGPSREPVPEPAQFARRPPWFLRLIRSFELVHLRIGMLVAYVVAALVVLAIAFWPQQGAFTVNALTEQLTLEVDPGVSLADWRDLSVTSAVTPIADLAASRTGRRCANPTLSLDDKRQALTRFVIAAAGSNNVAADIQSGSPNLPGASDARSLGVVKCADGRRLTAPSRVTVLWRAGGLTQAFTGRLEIGGQAGTSLKLLREGVLTVSAKSWPAANGAIDVERKLLLGDDVRVYSAAAEDRGESTSFGLFRPDAGALRVVSRAIGDHASVARLGEETAGKEAVGPNLWARFMAQPEAAVLLAILAVLVNAAAVFDAILVERKWARDRSLPDAPTRFFGRRWGM